MCVLEFAEENNKSEPVSHREDLVRIILVWCGQQDSNLHAFAEEPKGDVTLVNVLRCVKNTFLNNSNGYYRNAQVSSFVGDTIFLRISDKGSSLLIYFFTTILNSSF